MSTVGSIGQIETSLLNGAVAVGQLQSSVGAQGQAPGSTFSPDQVNVSPTAQLVQSLGDLRTNTPTDYQQVFQTVASRLNAAAARQTDPVSAALLQGASSQFQEAASSGKTASAAPDGGYSPQPSHHRHHPVPPAATEKPPLIPHIEQPGTIQYVLAQLAPDLSDPPVDGGA